MMVHAEKTEKSFIRELFDFYTEKSFGAVLKRDLDIFLFHAFQKAGLISEASLWEMAKELKITKSKAQNFLYESEILGKTVGEKIVSGVFQVLFKLRKNFKNKN